MSKEENKSVLSNNAGFSLFELLIVIAIMGIMVTGAILGINVVNNANVAKAANNFESVLDTARTQAMAKGPDAGLITLTMSGGKLMYQIGDPTTAEKKEVCTSAVTATYYTGAYAQRSGGYVITDGMIMVIQFNQDGTVNDGGILTMKKMIFTHGNRNVEVMLYTETGNHESAMFYN